MGPVKVCIRGNAKFSPARKILLEENSRSSFAYAQDTMPARIFYVPLIPDLATHFRVEK